MPGSVYQYSIQHIIPPNPTNVEFLIRRHCMADVEPKFVLKELLH